MEDVRVVELAGRQYNRFALSQLHELRVTERALRHRLEEGRWVAVHQAVFAIAPVLDDERGRWMAATLSEEGSVLSHASAAAAWGWWSLPRDFEIITRPGSGGPRRLDNLLVHRSRTLEDDATRRIGIPMTCAPRTLLDLAPHVTAARLARCVREAIRLGTTSTVELADSLTGRHRGRRGSRRLASVVSRYSGLPVDRARSGAEIAALELLRDAGCPMPRLNRQIAGEEADLSWPSLRLVIEIDGGPFHLDVGEDERKQSTWERAGYEVRRLPSDDVYRNPERLLALSPPPNVRRTPL